MKGPTDLFLTYNISKIRVNFEVFINKRIARVQRYPDVVRLIKVSLLRWAGHILA